MQPSDDKGSMSTCDMSWVLEHLNFRNKKKQQFGVILIA